ncbi:MAG: hypothetical protein HZB42_06740 [Sphingobacteriales bacterium]|nr:hypothetical protein [Sphingobacteriales bacterium]
MKSIIMPDTAHLNDGIREQLAKEVKETPALDAIAGKKRKFTAIDMWNRQKNYRSASDMLRRWNLN